MMVNRRMELGEGVSFEWRQTPLRGNASRRRHNSQVNDFGYRETNDIRARRAGDGGGVSEEGNGATKEKKSRFNRIDRNGWNTRKKECRLSSTVDQNRLSIPFRPPMVRGNGETEQPTPHEASFR
ncbi:unnamed protein product [Linum trigynum]|uniref:Uncharacterized protein n=1 Tax=Linum trigynum TaxID=586398 RepID=A0AAV2EUY1_9ROSI